MPVNNIYDMGGNVWEYTSENCSNTSQPVTRRSGANNGTYTNQPAASRVTTGRTDTSSYYGFRQVLFIAM